MASGSRENLGLSSRTPSPGIRQGRRGEDGETEIASRSPEKLGMSSRTPSRGIKRGRRGAEGDTEMESGSPEKLDLSRSLTSARFWYSRRALINYLSVRKQLRKKAKILMEREMQQSVEWKLESIGNMIEDAARNISATALSEQGESQDFIGWDGVVFCFCEQICEQVKELMNFFPASTEKEKQNQVPVLQSISDTIARFCAAHVQPAAELEEDQSTEGLGMDLEEVDAEIELMKYRLEESKAAIDLEEGQEANFSKETEEQEGSSRADVEGEAVVGRGKIEAGLGGDEIPSETEEAPCFDMYHKGKSVTEMRDEEFTALRKSSSADVDGEAVVARGKIEAGLGGDEIPTETEHKGKSVTEVREEFAALRKSSSADVDGEAVVARGKIEAGLGGDEIPMETEEAPLVDIYHKGKSVMEMQEKQFAAFRRSSSADVDGEVARGKIEAGLAGDKIPTETEEAPWVEIYHKGKSVAEMEEEEFAAFRRFWERQWGNGKSKSFEDLSLLSPMMFTHRTPGCSSIGAVVGRTFQVYSVKIAEIKGIQWPLKVYGVIAARDDVDKNRNPLFLRSRTDYQIVDQKDPFLQLTGPCRAIVSEEPIEIEIQLRVNRGKKSDDRPLISDVFYYNGDIAKPSRSSSKIDNHLCEIELSYQQLKESVQATLFGFHVGDPLPFDFGVKIVCSSLPQGSDVIEPEVRQVVLFDSRCGKVPMGNLKLSRQVVSVELKGMLRILIQSYASSGGIAAHGSVFITPQDCHTSQHVCYISGSEVKFTIAWSLLLADKTIMLMDGYVDPYEDLPPFDPSVLEMLGISE